MDRKVTERKGCLDPQHMKFNSLHQRILNLVFLQTLVSHLFGGVCKVNTQDPENFDEELKSLVTAWLTLVFLFFLPGR